MTYSLKLIINYLVYIKISINKRTSGAGHLKIADFIEEVIPLARDQHGSRFVQIKLEKSQMADKNLIFTKLLPECQNLMVDVFGNYVVQKLFEFGSIEHKEKLCQLIQVIMIFLK